ncbi:MAG: VTT domain-containing protein [Anaerolineaceae bacterium]|nr:VTT domain-containing protein [Anaerolineaceae bacterium]
MAAPAEKRKILLRVVIIFALIILTIFLLLNRDKIQEFEKFGYTGIFFVSILSNATLVMPIPGVIFTSAMGAVFNPFWVAVAAGCGAALGELTGYLAGFSGQFVVERKGWYQQLTKWVEKYGNLTVFVMAFIPNPLFDLTGIAAGALKMPIPRFLFWCVLGKILKMLFFALTGSSVLQFMEI